MKLWRHVFGRKQGIEEAQMRAAADTTDRRWQALWGIAINLQPPKDEYALETRDFHIPDVADLFGRAIVLKKM
ncbi:MAG: hypothetical protein FJ276_09725 [Planctomycetes bacterium]|nr:hypothetical protein [Planctomycetota bacterium]